MLDVLSEKDAQALCEYVIGIKPINFLTDFSCDVYFGVAIEFQDHNNEWRRQAVRFPENRDIKDAIPALCIWALQSLGMSDKNAKRLANERIAEFDATHLNCLASDV